MKYQIKKSFLLQKLDQRVNGLSVVDTIVNTDFGQVLLSGGCMENLYKDFKNIGKDLFVPVPYKFMFGGGKGLFNTKKEKLAGLKEYFDYINSFYNKEIFSVCDKKESTDIINKHYFDKIDSKFTNIFNDFNDREIDFGPLNVSMSRSFPIFNNITLDGLYTKFRLSGITGVSNLYSNDINVSSDIFEKILLKYCKKVTIKIRNSNDLKKLEKDQIYIYKTPLLTELRLSNTEISYDNTNISTGAVIKYDKKDDVIKIKHTQGLTTNAHFYTISNLKDLNDTKFNELEYFTTIYKLKTLNIVNYTKDQKITLYKIQDINDLKYINIEVQYEVLKNYIARLESHDLNKLVKKGLLSSYKLIAFDHFIEYAKKVSLPIMESFIQYGNLDSYIETLSDNEKIYNQIMTKFDNDIVMCKINVSNFPHDHKMSSLYLLTLLRYVYYDATSHLAELIIKMKRSVGDKYSFYEILHAASNHHDDRAWHRYNLVNCRSSQYLDDPDGDEMSYFYYIGDEAMSKAFNNKKRILNNMFTGSNHIKDHVLDTYNKINLCVLNNDYEGLINIFRKN